MLVGVVIGTWWDDQIITGNEPNLILALPGDDCVEAAGQIRTCKFAPPPEVPEPKAHA